MSNKVIISKISHGLGNQLFQYALGRNLAIKNKAELLLDISFYNDPQNNTKREFLLNKFNISAKIANKETFETIGIADPNDNSTLAKIKRKLFRLKEFLKPIEDKKFITEPKFEFIPEILNVKESAYLAGAWQSEKYFKDIEKIIRKELSLKNDLSGPAENWIKKIDEHNSISIHIRRGDYVSNQKTNQFHGICGADYYEKAIEIMGQKTKNPEFFIFSDDIEWAKKNLEIKFPIHFVSGVEIPDYEELMLMSRCKNNIIANSTFSWWGAWLNNNGDKIVIAPKKWFNSNTNTKDLLPETWLSI